MSKVKCIGIIAEDLSDFESLKTIINRIIKKTNIPYKKAIGNGCGKLRRKAADYAVDLKKRGCNMLILVHDLDRNNLSELRNNLENILKESPINNKIICIPMEEIEAWYLSDPDTIKSALKLKRKPNIRGNPEKISSPKETLGALIRSCSDKNLIYLNTKHNQVLAEKISLELMYKKCTSYSHFHDFVVGQSY